MRPLPPLTDSQAQGAAPGATVWVSASAGAGKTQLLAARMLRLMLRGAPPERLLALTFTKAAAAEMLNRVLGRLAHWASAPEAAVAADLVALGAAAGAHEVAAARALFGRALDARGGLKVRTIHAFAAELLAGFPLEAGVPPDFTVLDERNATEIGRDSFDALIARPPTPGFLDDVASLAGLYGGDRLEKVLARMEPHGEAIAALGPPAGIEPALRRRFGLPEDGTTDMALVAGLNAIKDADLARLAHAFERDSAPHPSERADAIRGWLALDPAGRAAAFGTLAIIFLTKENAPRKQVVPKSMCDADPGCQALASALRDAVLAASDMRRLLEVAALAALHLRVGGEVCRERQRRKEDAGALAFDDIIARAGALLDQPGAAEWVRFKLDGRVDHILVDEAQDTSEEQWRIVRALSQEFFAGEGARELGRTLFAVGDYKQSIFGFQGADPSVFAAERLRLEAMGVEVADVALADNFRSAPVILKLVDKVIEQSGHATLGLSADVPAHVARGSRLAGAVTLWPAVPSDAEDEEGDGERGWVSTAERVMAARLARQIARWTAGGLVLPSSGRTVEPQDILILVRRRREFVGALVAALAEAGVPVAGADRLRLSAPLAVRDMRSLMRFVLQPGDDLALGELLVSPLCGWSQDELFELAHPREGSLWRALGEDTRPRPAEAAAWLREAMRLADFMPPNAWIETVLSGPLGGRARLLARLGPDAGAALDELIHAAFAFQEAHAPSLQGFLAWLDAGDVELKRDPDAPRAEVRVMTVHGAKGLQAPVIVLADAVRHDETDRDGFVMMEVEGRSVPVFHGGTSGKLGPVGQACSKAAQRRREEEARLLYVALTRAEELLFLGGALARRAKTGPKPASWHGVVEQALTGLGALADPADADIWEEPSLKLAEGAAGAALAACAPPPPVGALPDWATCSAPPEPAPPRPLRPSRIAAGDDARPPASPAAAERGRLVHALLERLPTVAPPDRAAAADRYLAANAPALPPGERNAIARAVLDVLEDAALAHVFGPQALAEAPVAAVVEGLVVAGKVDRLLVTAAGVTVIDFKTGAVPAGPRPADVRQLALYRAALQRIFPGRAVAAGLVYTSGPALVMLEAGALDAALAEALTAARASPVS